MTASYKTLMTKFGAFLFALFCVSAATAQCGGMRQPSIIHSGWHAQLGQARLLAINDSAEWGQAYEAEIVGFWHVKFVTKDSPGIPDGTEVDAGYSQWHSDGTEIMNSGGRSPITSNFCLGVWKKVGECKYKLNHFATAWDATGANLIGPAQIREEVTVDHDGKHFSGKFTIDQFDEAGNTLAHVQGDITGSRIHVDSLATSVF